MIPWRPIAELPDELKDGREVLVCEANDEGASFKVGQWSYGRIRIFEPFEDDWTWTHFAEITPP